MAGKTIMRAGQLNEDTLQDYDSDTKIQVEEASDEDKIRFDTAGTERMIIDNAGNVGIGTTTPEAYLDIKNTTDDGATNRTMIQMYNYRADDANENDWAPTSIDFKIENVAGGVKGATARIATVIAPVGTDHNSTEGERSSALIFSTMDDSTLSEAMRINNLGNVGIGLSAPIVRVDVHHDPTGLSDDTGGGEVVTFGTEDTTDTLAAGRLMYMATDGKWKYADADTVATSGGVLLGLALGTAVTDGILLKGYFDVATIEGSFVKGGACYVSELEGAIDFTAPSVSGDVVRVVGYGTDTANVIYFDPSSTWIEL